MQQSIEVQLRMEKGMYGRLVERAKDQGMPLSAVVRDAVVQYFENFPEVADEDLFMPAPDDPIWDIPESAGRTVLCVCPRRAMGARANAPLHLHQYQRLAGPLQPERP